MRTDTTPLTSAPVTAPEAAPEAAPVTAPEAAPAGGLAAEIRAAIEAVNRRTGYLGPTVRQLERWAAEAERLEASRLHKPEVPRHRVANPIPQDHEPGRAVCGNCRRDMLPLADLTPGQSVACPHCGFVQWMERRGSEWINHPGHPDDTDNLAREWPGSCGF